ncbi:hypothetical protein ACUJ7E_001423 [Escherichia fergusonii]
MNKIQFKKATNLGEELTERWFIPVSVAMNEFGIADISPGRVNRCQCQTAEERLSWRVGCQGGLPCNGKVQCEAAAVIENGCVIRVMYTRPCHLQ